MENDWERRKNATIVALQRELEALNALRQGGAGAGPSQHAQQGGALNDSVETIESAQMSDDDERPPLREPLVHRGQRLNVLVLPRDRSVAPPPPPARREEPPTAVVLGPRVPPSTWELSRAKAVLFYKEENEALRAELRAPKDVQERRVQEVQGRADAQARAAAEREAALRAEIERCAMEAKEVRQQALAEIESGQAAAEALTQEWRLKAWAVRRFRENVWEQQRRRRLEGVASRLAVRTESGRLQACWSAWVEAVRTGWQARRAQARAESWGALHDRLAGRSALLAWADVAAERARLRRRSLRFTGRCQQRLAARVLRAWGEQADERRVEGGRMRQAERWHTGRLLLHAWRGWRQCTDDAQARAQTAHNLCEQGLLRRAWASLLDATNAAAEGRARVERMARWRGRRVLRAWRDTAGVTVEARRYGEALADAREAARDQRRVLAAWEGWRDAVQQARGVARLAQVVRRWVPADEERLARGVWEAWRRSALVSARAERMAARRRAGLLRGAMRAWRVAVQKAAGDAARADAAVERARVRLGGRVLLAWATAAQRSARAAAEECGTQLASTLQQTRAQLAATAGDLGSARRDLTRARRLEEELRAEADELRRTEALARARECWGPVLSPNGDASAALVPDLVWRQVRAGGDEPTARERLACAWVPADSLVGSRGPAAFEEAADAPLRLAGGASAILRSVYRVAGALVMVGGVTGCEWLRDVAVLVWRPRAEVRVLPGPPSPASDGDGAATGSLVDAGEAGAHTAGDAGGAAGALPGDLTRVGDAGDGEGEAEGRWTWLETHVNGDTPPPRRDVASCAIGGGRVLLFGGFDGARAMGDAHVVSVRLSRQENEVVAEATWEPFRAQNKAPSARYGHSMACDEASGDVVVFGGWREEPRGLCCETFALSVSRKQWHCPQVSGDVPSPRRGHASCFVGGWLYVHGGHDGSRHLADLYRVRPGDWRWERLGTGEAVCCPAPRRQHAACAAGHLLVLHGGYDGDRFLNDAWAFDTHRGTWARLEARTPPGEAPAARAAHCVAAAGWRLLVAGGVGRAGSVPGVHALENASAARGAAAVHEAAAAREWARVARAALLDASGQHAGARERARAAAEAAASAAAEAAAARAAAARERDARGVLAAKLRAERAHAATLASELAKASAAVGDGRRRLAAAFEDYAALAAAAEQLGAGAQCAAEEAAAARARAADAEARAEAAAKAAAEERASAREAWVRVQYAERDLEEARAGVAALPTTVERVRNETRAEMETSLEATRAAYEAEVAALRAELVPLRERVAAADEAVARARAAQAEAEAEGRRREAEAQAAATLLEAERARAAADPGERRKGAEAVAVAAAAAEEAAAAREAMRRRAEQLATELSAAQLRAARAEAEAVRLEAVCAAAETARDEATAAARSACARLSDAVRGAKERAERDAARDANAVLAAERATRAVDRGVQVSPAASPPPETAGPANPPRLPGAPTLPSVSVSVGAGETADAAGTQNSLRGVSGTGAQGMPSGVANMDEVVAAARDIILRRMARPLHQACHV